MPTTDIREDWFMNQHFSKTELQKIYEWEQKSGKVADVVAVVGGFDLYHSEDKRKKILLGFQKQEYMLRRWAERLGYKISDGKTSKQFEVENGIKDQPASIGKEVFSNKALSIEYFEEERKFKIVSGDFALVTKRTASNAFEIQLLTSVEYNKWLESAKQKWTN